MALTENVTDPSLLALLRSDLAAASYTVDRLEDLWGAEAAAALRRSHRVPALRAINAAPPTPLGTLARLFVLGLPTDAAMLTAALPSLGVPGAVELKIVASDGGLVVPLVDLQPHSAVDAQGVIAWWILSDLTELSVGGALREDHVLGIGGASTTLCGLMIGDPVESALDLGTGCGIQAMHASRHAIRVVATDISERALNFASMNAELNGIDTIEFRLGSLFEPVAGERFDQIVSNPPFVITPRTTDVPAYEYRDGGMVGDDLVRAVVAGVADHLEPGGVAQLLGNWEYRVATAEADVVREDGLERVGGWIDDTRLDGWVVERERQDAALYAETWIRDGGRRSPVETERLTGLWLDDFASRGVSEVGFGYLLLRHPSGPSRLRRLERLDGPLGHNATGLGGSVAATAAAHDWLTLRDDAHLLSEHLAIASDVTEERHYWPGEEHPTVMTLRQGGGFGRSMPLDTELAAFVGTCDGDLPVAAIIDAIAQLLEVDAATLRSHLLPSIRELVLTGFLAPAA